MVFLKGKPERPSSSITVGGQATSLKFSRLGQSDLVCAQATEAGESWSKDVVIYLTRGEAKTLGEWLLQ